MPLILPGNVASATASTSDNSCRFNKADSANMYKANGGTGNRRTWTISIWVKRSLVGAEQHMFSVRNDTTTPYVEARFEANDTVQFYDYTGAGNYVFRFVTNATFTDTSAWSNFVFKLDTEQGTEANRAKIYHNGAEITSFSTAVYPSEDDDTSANVSGYNSTVGNLYGSVHLFSGYIAEFCLIDGLALAPTSFGEFEDSLWKPIDVSGLTFGTNGFYLDFEDSANLGNDANGGTDLTEVNLDATDQALDAPTNSFATINPSNVNEMTLSQGNCVVTSNSSPRTDDNARGLLEYSKKTGKWYWEVKTTGTYYPGVVGICSENLGTGDDLSGSEGVYAIQNWGGTYAARRENGTTAETAGFPNPTNGQIFNLAFDAGNGKLYIGNNGSYFSQDGSAGDPAGGSNETFASIDTNLFWIPWFEARSTSQNGQFNFGGCSGFTVSSGNTDENGYGNFEYAVPDGFLALCTQNLETDPVTN